jgi:hypothetical protein
MYPSFTHDLPIICQLFTHVPTALLENHFDTPHQLPTSAVGVAAAAAWRIENDGKMAKMMEQAWQNYGKLWGNHRSSCPAPGCTGSFELLKIPEIRAASDLFLSLCLRLAKNPSHVATKTPSNLR